MSRLSDLPLSSTDHEVLAQAAAGLAGRQPADAFNTVHAFLAGPLRNVAEGRLAASTHGTQLDPDDVVQAIFVRLHTTLSQGKLPALHDAEELWRLLVRWVIDELRNAVREGGSFRREQGPPDAAAWEDPAKPPGRSSVYLDEEHEAQRFKWIASEKEASTDFSAEEVAEFLKRYPEFRNSSPEPWLGSPEPRGAAALTPREIAERVRDSGLEPAERATNTAADATGTSAVDCTAFAPPEAHAGESLLVQVFAHLPAQNDEARALAVEVDDTARRRGSTTLALEVAPGTRLHFLLRMPGLAVDDELADLTWWGRPTAVQFGVTVPVEHAGGNVIGTIMISQDQVPVGQIKFPLRIRGGEPARAGAPASIPSSSGAPARAPALAPAGIASAFETFFVSYASPDRTEVLKRIQMALRLGKRVFQDILNLDPGDRWEQKLYLHIDECDAFLLFWSSHAKQSEWVLRECRYALEKKGIECLIPVILEGPPPVKPPPELEALHFNDRVLYFMR